MPYARPFPSFPLHVQNNADTVWNRHPTTGGAPANHNDPDAGAGMLHHTMAGDMAPPMPPPVGSIVGPLPGSHMPGPLPGSQMVRPLPGLHMMGPFSNMQMNNGMPLHPSIIANSQLPTPATIYGSGSFHPHHPASHAGSMAGGYNHRPAMSPSHSYRSGHHSIGTPGNHSYQQLRHPSEQYPDYDQNALGLRSVPEMNAPGQVKRAEDYSPVPSQSYAYGMQQYGGHSFRPEGTEMLNKLNPYGRAFPYGMYKTAP